MKQLIIILVIASCVFALFGINSAQASNTDYKGSILLDVERNGEAYYIFQGYKYYLGRPAQAFEIMRRLSLGISEDSYHAGLKQVNDIWQIYRVVDSRLYPHIQGRIILRPQANGEAYYVTPNLAMSNGYSAEYLGRPYDAFQIMTKYGQGVHSVFIDLIPSGSL